MFERTKAIANPDGMVRADDDEDDESRFGESKWVLKATSRETGPKHERFYKPPLPLCPLSPVLPLISCPLLSSEHAFDIKSRER